MNKWLLALVREAFRITKWKRRAFFLIADTGLISFSLYASFWLRFDGRIPAEFLEQFPLFLAIFLAVKLIFLHFSGMYSFSWRFFGPMDMARFFAGVTGSTIVLAIILMSLRGSQYLGGFPRSVVLVDYALTFGLLGGLRLSKRVVREYLNKSGRRLRGRKRALIIGAGEAGNIMAREMLKNEKSQYAPVGFIDDDPAKRGLSISGIKVLGNRQNIGEVLRANHIDEVLIAIPSARSKEIRELVNLVRAEAPSKKISVIPGMLGLVEGKVSLNDIKEVSVEDLLGREKVEVDEAAISSFIKGKRVLITGAGGSIGSELSRAVFSYKPANLTVLDIDETELFYLMNRLQGGQAKIRAVVADIRDAAKMERIFASGQPEIVIHSAAYKHVPILEDFPEEAIKTNVLGTKILAELAIKYGVERFVNISTDKAINPTSVMGSSKRVAEELLRAMNRRNSTRFISVRFGNVLGSRGSVIPLFEDQIKRGGPVTVTHPEMKRYFMAISEAVILVLQAAAAGEGGEVFVLDMGEPIKIVDLAKEMIRLSGFEPEEDIPIVFSGIRSGEKLFEELLGAEEGSESTGHPKIFRVRSSRDRLFNDEIKKMDDELLKKVDDLIAMSGNCAYKEEIIGMIKEIVPTYRP